MISVDQKQKDVADCLKGIQKAIDEGQVDQFFVVTLDFKGDPIIYYAGNWHNLAKASAFLNGEFVKHLIGVCNH